MSDVPLTLEEALREAIAHVHWEHNCAGEQRWQDALDAGRARPAPVDGLAAHGVIEYDDQAEWLVETDAEGASRVVASEVPRWFGRLVVAVLDAERARPEGNTR